MSWRALIAGLALLLAVPAFAAKKKAKAVDAEAEDPVDERAPAKEFFGTGWLLPDPVGFWPDPYFKPGGAKARWFHDQDVPDMNSKLEEWIDVSAVVLKCEGNRWRVGCKRSDEPEILRRGGHYEAPSFEYNCLDGGEREGEWEWGRTRHFDLIYGKKSPKECKVLRLSFRGRWTLGHPPSRQGGEPGLLPFAAMIRDLRPVEPPPLAAGSPAKR